MAAAKSAARPDWTRAPAGLPVEVVARVQRGVPGALLRRCCPPRLSPPPIRPCPSA